MLRVAGVVAFFLAALVRPGPAAAVDIPPELQNSRIGYVYEQPKAAKFQALYERLKNREVLENLKAFLSPLRLPRKLVLSFRECGVANAYYSPSEGLILCYEYIDYMESLAPKDTTPEGFTRAEGIAGAFLEVTLHELGHAVFDILEVPIYGREEDAADQFAGFIMLQFSSDMARFAIKGAAWSYLSQEQDWQGNAFADEHGTERQRFYNYLCLGYGKMPEEFQDMVDKGLLPPDRAVHCAREYAQVQNAFVQTVLPFIDRKLMEIVQRVRWVRPDEMKRK